MKFFAVILVALAISAQADESEYHNYQTHYDQHQPDPYASYNQDLTSAYTNTLTEKDSGYGGDDLDMDVILPIVVFGGIGIGVIAYIDTLNRQRDLCNKLREITNLTPMVTAANVALAVDGTGANGAGRDGAGAAAQVNPANAAINSNVAFIAALAAITNLDC